jgi:hypothetical protein
MALVLVSANFDLLVEGALSNVRSLKTDAPFFEPNTETSLLKFKETGPFKMT